MHCWIPSLTVYLTLQIIKVDDDTKYFRGGYVWIPPALYGKRYAFKVLGRFDNDKWLGKQGQRAGPGSSKGELLVSYYGTRGSVSGSIAQDGYNMSKGKQFL